MKTLLFFLSVVLLIIFFGDLIFKGGSLSTNEGKEYNLNSSQVYSANEANRNKLYAFGHFLTSPVSINQIDSMTASENLKFTKPNAQKLIVKM